MNRLLWGIVVPLLLTSCSVQATLTLQPEGPVTVQSSFALEAPTLRAWQNLRELDPTLPADPLSRELLLSGLGKGARVTTEGKATTVSFTLTAPGKTVPTLKTGGDFWDLTLDRGTIRKLLSLTAWGTSPAVDSLIPAPGTKVTDAEYRDLLVYLLGSELSEPAARALIAASTVDLTVVAPRPIKAAASAASIEGNSARYRWPLVRLLTLDPPIRLKITF